MKQVETKKKKISKIKENPKKKLVSANLELQDIERYYSVFGYHDYYIEEQESIKIGMFYKFKLMMTKFFNWVLSFLNCFPL